MRMTEEEIAMYKISEAMKTIDLIRNSPDEFVKVFDMVVNLKSKPLFKWNVLQSLLLSLNISIQKPRERPESLDDLSGSEFNRRLEFRSCHNPLCPKPHCTECEKCGHKKHDGHLCICPICGLEYITSADGDVHNLDGECKEASDTV